MNRRHMLAITEWIGSYSLKRLGPDGVAGLSLAAFVIPESLAYAWPACRRYPVSIAISPPASPMPCLERAGSWR
jgi:MFS superfamily sulfate permease-like transporter